MLLAKVSVRVGFTPGLGLGLGLEQICVLGLGLGLGWKPFWHQGTKSAVVTVNPTWLMVAIPQNSIPTVNGPAIEGFRRAGFEGSRGYGSRGRHGRVGVAG